MVGFPWKNRLKCIAERQEAEAYKRKHVTQSIIFVGNIKRNFIQFCIAFVCIRKQTKKKPFTECEEMFFSLNLMVILCSFLENYRIRYVTLRYHEFVVVSVLNMLFCSNKENKFLKKLKLEEEATCLAFIYVGKCVNFWRFFYFIFVLKVSLKKSRVFWQG